MPLRIRVQCPQQFTDYRKYKSYLRIEFDYCCAYCNVREPEIGGSQSFHIDHYRPKRKFPEESCNYSNLFYSCRDCNTCKGAFWPSFVDSLVGRFVLNPCYHDFDEHYDRTHITWIAKSKVAEWNLKRLRLNSSKRQQIREERECIYKLVKELEKQEIEITQILLTPEADNMKTSALKERLLVIQESLKMLKHKTNGSMD